VLASHWYGAPLFLALNSAKGFESIQSIRIGVVLDEKDPTGPASRHRADCFPPRWHSRGRRVWLSGDSAKGKVETIDGRSLDATAYSPLDIIITAAATGASDIRFDLVTDESSSRRRVVKQQRDRRRDRGEVDGRTKRSRSMMSSSRVKPRSRV